MAEPNRLKKVQEKMGLGWQPWLRMPGENSKQLELFTIFMLLGPSERSIEEVQKHAEAKSQKPIPLSRLRALQSKFLWKKRVEAWDDHIVGFIVEDHEKAAQEMVNRHASQSKMFQDYLINMLPEIDLIETPSKQVWAMERLMNAYRQAVDIERISRGEPTAKVETSGGLNQLNVMINQSLEKVKSKGTKDIIITSDATIKSRSNATIEAEVIDEEETVVEGEVREHDNKQSETPEEEG